MSLQVKNDRITRMAHEMIQGELVKITSAMIEGWSRDNAAQHLELGKKEEF